MSSLDAHVSSPGLWKLSDWPVRASLTEIGKKEQDICREEDRQGKKDIGRVWVGAT